MCVASCTQQSHMNVGCTKADKVLMVLFFKAVDAPCAAIWCLYSAPYSIPGGISLENSSVIWHNFLKKTKGASYASVWNQRHIEVQYGTIEYGCVIMASNYCYSFLVYQIYYFHCYFISNFIILSNTLCFILDLPPRRFLYFYTVHCLIFYFNFFS